MKGGRRDSQDQQRAEVKQSSGLDGWGQDGGPETKARKRAEREDWLPGWSRWEEQDTNSYNLLQEACNYRARVSPNHRVPVGIKTPRCRG